MGNCIASTLCAKETREASPPAYSKIATDNDMPADVDSLANDNDRPTPPIERIIDPSIVDIVEVIHTTPDGRACAIILGHKGWKISSVRTYIVDDERNIAYNVGDDYSRENILQEFRSLQAGQVGAWLHGAMRSRPGQVGISSVIGDVGSERNMMIVTYYKDYVTYTRSPACKAADAA